MISISSFRTAIEWLRNISSRIGTFFRPAADSDLPPADGERSSTAAPQLFVWGAKALSNWRKKRNARVSAFHAKRRASNTGGKLSIDAQIAMVNLSHEKLQSAPNQNSTEKKTRSLNEIMKAAMDASAHGRQLLRQEGCPFSPATVRTNPYTTLKKVLQNGAHPVLYYQSNHFVSLTKRVPTRFRTETDGHSFVKYPAIKGCQKHYNHATALALTCSIILRIPAQMVKSAKTSTTLPLSVKGDSCKTEKSFINPLWTIYSTI